jgi:glycosyltransferase involved in cell wall biosynthesis/predicted O-methyltransferase YrrM
MPLGIAIVTYQRLDRLKGVVDAVRRFTTGEYELVVADDGSTDGTAAWCTNEKIRVITGPNRGVCWNKNRGLLALYALGCDPVLLLEDDIVPVRDGWQQDWIDATRRFDHLAFAHDKIAEQVIEGTGSPDDPFVNRKATAQCTSVSRRVLDEVGYLDSRFVGYGVGHAEWTTRVKRAGMGSKPVVLEDGVRAKANLYIKGGLEARDAPSFRDNSQVKANRALFDQIRHEPVFRAPWRSEGERAAMLDELELADITDVTLPKETVLSNDVDGSHEAPLGNRTELIVNERRPKWDTHDLFALQTMQPLGGGYVPWTSFSLRPSALQTLMNEIDAYRPSLIVECGSGASTLMICRLLRARGYGGRLVSIENDNKWAAFIASLLEKEGLSDFGRVVLSPLRDWDGKLAEEPSDFAAAVRWYDPDDIIEAVGEDKIGLLFVDGPPGSKQLSRYPAVPELRELLADDAVIMLDDSNRPAEAETARQWSAMLGTSFTVYKRMSLAVGRRGAGFTLLGC